MWSNYYSTIANEYDIEMGDALHYRNVLLEMKLVSVYRVLKLKQFDWLKKYIDFNTDKKKY